MTSLFCVSFVPTKKQGYMKQKFKDIMHVVLELNKMQ